MSDARLAAIRGAGIVRAITGFTNVVDLTFGPDGYLYVAELSQSGLLSGQMDGAVWRVNPEPTPRPTPRRRRRRWRRCRRPVARRLARVATFT